MYNFVIRRVNIYVARHYSVYPRTHRRSFNSLKKEFFFFFSWYIIIKFLYSHYNLYTYITAELQNIARDYNDFFSRRYSRERNSLEKKTISSVTFQMKKKLHRVCIIVPSCELYLSAHIPRLHIYTHIQSLHANVYIFYVHYMYNIMIVTNRFIMFYTNVSK